MTSYYTPGQQVQRASEVSRNGERSTSSESYGRVVDMCQSTNCRSPGYPTGSSFEEFSCSVSYQGRSREDYRNGLQNNNYIYQPPSFALNSAARPNYALATTGVDCCLQNSATTYSPIARDPPTPTTAAAPPMYPWMAIVGKANSPYSSPTYMTPFSQYCHEPLAFKYNVKSLYQASKMPI